MKTKPMDHQVTGCELLAKYDNFMLACEQGTGKTWMLLADTEARFDRNEIDALLVVAPSGVHTNWTRREIPTHLSCDCLAVAYSSGPTKRLLKQIEQVMTKDTDDRKLHILTMSIDSVNTQKGYDIAKRFLIRFRDRCVFALDESSRIKNMTSKRTEKILMLSDFAKIKRPMSGTPITNSPSNAFPQFEFMQPGLLGTTSYRSFVAEYSQLLPPNNRMVLDIIQRRSPGLVAEYRAAMARGDTTVAHDILRRLARMAPQIVATDTEGRPKYRNLEKLRGLMAPHLYRVTKAECLDLPDKIFTNNYFELSPEQRRLYTLVDEEMRWEDEDGNLDVFTAMTKLTKLQQITSGFIHTTEAGLVYVEEGATARIKALMDVVEDIDGKFIIWARYKEEVRSICAALAAAGIEYVEYHGDVSKADREKAIESLQAGSARAFVGNAASGGIGLTLTAAETAIYYSNDFNLETRLQSEDRCHRIGTVNHINYIDLVAINSIDEKIALALQNKEEVATTLLRKA